MNISTTCMLILIFLGSLMLIYSCQFKGFTWVRWTRDCCRHHQHVSRKILYLELFFWYVLHYFLTEFWHSTLGYVLAGRQMHKSPAREGGSPTGVLPAQSGSSDCSSYILEREERRGHLVSWTLFLPQKLICRPPTSRLLASPQFLSSPSSPIRFPAGCSQGVSIRS